jgi:hypothetical protein
VIFSKLANNNIDIGIGIGIGKIIQGYKDKKTSNPYGFEVFYHLMNLVD